MGRTTNGDARAPAVRDRATRRSRAHSVLLCLLISFLVSGCGGGLTGEPVPDLHVPGAVRITALDDLLSQKPPPQLSDLAAYAGPESGHPPHLLVRVGKLLYDVDVDGQQARLLDDQSPCMQHLAVSPDSAWAACAADDGIRMFELPPLPNRPTANSVNPLGDRLVLPNGTGDEAFYSPTWGPDGHSLALLWRQSGKPPAIAVYTVPAAHDTLRPSAVIDLADVPAPAAIFWSPDGTWLHLWVTIGYLLPADPLLTSPGTRTIAPDHLAGAVVGVPGFPVIWRPSDSTLTLAQGVSIVSLAPGEGEGGRETPLLTIPDGEVCGLAWSPDGRRLILGLCRRVAETIVPPPNKLYVYTPGGS